MSENEAELTNQAEEQKEYQDEPIINEKEIQESLPQDTSEPGLNDISQQPQQDYQTFSKHEADDRKKQRFQEMYGWEEKLHQKTNIFKSMFFQMNKSLINAADTSNKNSLSLIQYLSEKASIDARYSIPLVLKLEKQEENSMTSILIDFQAKQDSIRSEFKVFAQFTSDLVEKQLKPDYENHTRLTNTFKSETQKQLLNIDASTKRISSRFYDYRKYYQEYIRLQEKGKHMEKDMFTVEDAFIRSVRTLISCLKQFGKAQVVFYRELILKEKQRRILTIELLKLFMEESLKIYANNQPLKDIIDQINSNEDLPNEFNQLKVSKCCNQQFENLILPEQYHYIRQVHPDLDDQALLDQFIEQFDIKYIPGNQLVLYQFLGGLLDQNMHKTKHGLCFVYFTADLNIVVLPEEQYSSEPLHVLLIPNTVPVYNQTTKILTLREIKKGIFNSRKDVHFNLEQEHAIECNQFFKRSFGITGIIVDKE